ncbi:MAG TPA: hypothetical protein VGL12_00175, partial [Roseiarcus sp.]
MATKADFTPDEWKLLLQSPLIAGVAVSTAEPSGLIGMMRESMASARALIQAKTDPNADALVKAVAGEFETSEGRGLAQDGVKTAISGAKAPADIVAKALTALKATSALLDAKGGLDAAPFKTWLAGIAKSVAEAAPEGGFLGFGGTQVSEAEKATVVQIAGALGVQAP